jgi:hypothetical protein
MIATMSLKNALLLNIEQQGKLQAHAYHVRTHEVHIEPLTSTKSLTPGETHEMLCDQRLLTVEPWTHFNSNDTHAARGKGEGEMQLKNST